MIAVNLVWIFFLAAFIAVFITLVIFSVLALNTLSQENRSFLRSFPCEAIRTKAGFNRAYHIILYIFSGLCFAPLFVVLPLINEFGGLGVFAIIIPILFGIEGMLGVSIFLFNIRYTVTHTKLATGFMVGSFLVNALTAIYAGLTYNSWSKIASASALPLAMGVVAGVLMIMTILIMVNPKLKDWAQLEQIENKNDDPTYRRPRFFPLAYSEWAILLINFIGEVAFFITLVH